MDKIKTCFDRIELNTPIFHKEAFEPTLINFLYGKNGTGKTTISRCLKDKTAVTHWQPGIDPSEVRLFVYNEDFIQENVQSYGNIPGVFTITKQNAELKKAADEATAEKTTLENKAQALLQQANMAAEESRKSEEKHAKKIWSDTDQLRKRKYPEIKFVNSAARLAAMLEDILKKKPDLQEIRQEEIDVLYSTIFDSNKPQGSQVLELYRPLSIAEIPSSPLIGKKIVGLADTPFSDFVKKLGALDWISAGHDRFHKDADGFCPYCQQRLPDDFEEKLSACYDEEYKKDIQALEHFIGSYGQAANALFRTIAANLAIPYETPLRVEYAALRDLLMERCKQNRSILDAKKASPGTEQALVDISDIVENINQLTEKINAGIKEYNAVLADPRKSDKCKNMILEYMAYKYKADISTRSALRQKESADEQKLRDNATQLKKDAQKLEAKIRELNKSTVNTTAAKDSINAMLENSGFQGFKLREKRDSQYVYELVRQNANGSASEIAWDLSEGERHFIAFLYFYHTVIGSQTDDGIRTSKVVVIDDPVSSMDSDTLFVVSALTRELISVCYNNFDLSDEEGREDYIRQIFCLTHNPYFFREITYGWEADYESVSFFEVKKHKGNRSTIELSTRESKEPGGGKINVSPVRNGYDALWHEYNTTENPETLMIVIRQILEYYFFQLRGYKNQNLRYELLDKHKTDFETIRTDGSKDTTAYSLAAAMISFLNVGATGFNDGLFFDSSAANIGQLRSTFRRIFEVMHQEQHYEMMTAQ